MSIGPVQASPGASPPPTPEAELREVARQLEGVFIQQLFRAMRESAPEGSTATTRSSNEFFGAMMDEHMANVATSRLGDSLGEALYRQLARIQSAQGAHVATAPTEEGS